MEPTAVMAILGSLAAHILRRDGDEAAVEAREQGLTTLGPEMIDDRDYRPHTPSLRAGGLDFCQVSSASVVRFLRQPCQVTSSRSRPSLVSRIQLQGNC